MGLLEKVITAGVAAGGVLAAANLFGNAEKKLKEPTRIPTINAQAKPLITSPPNNAIAIITTNVEAEVFTQRANVLFNAPLMFSLSVRQSAFTNKRIY